MNKSEKQAGIDNRSMEYLRAFEVQKDHPLERLDMDCRKFINAAKMMSQQGTSPVDSGLVLENYQSLRNQLNGKLVVLRPRSGEPLAHYLDAMAKELRDAALMVIQDDVHNLEADDGKFEDAARTRRKSIFHGKVKKSKEKDE